MRRYLIDWAVAGMIAGVAVIAGAPSTGQTAAFAEGLTGPNATFANARILGSSDLPKIHSEYNANQARGTMEFLGKMFSSELPLMSMNPIGNDMYSASFQEKPGDWMPGVTCRSIMPSQPGDRVWFRGLIENHSFGGLDLEYCQFFASEEAAEEADRREAAART